MLVQKVGTISVTRSGNLLDFGQQLICPNLPHSLAIFVKVSKSIIFLVKSFLGKFYRQLAIFSGHTGYYLPMFNLYSST